MVIAVLRGPEENAPARGLTKRSPHGLAYIRRTSRICHPDISAGVVVVESAIFGNEACEAFLHVCIAAALPGVIPGHCGQKHEDELHLLLLPIGVTEEKPS